MSGFADVLVDIKKIMTDKGLVFLTIPNNMLPSNAQNYYWNYNVDVVEILSDINQSTIKRNKTIFNILIYKRVKGSNEMSSYEDLLVLCENLSKDFETTTNWNAILNLYHKETRMSFDAVNTLLIATMQIEVLYNI